MGSICISLVTNNVEHVFNLLIGHYIPSLEKYKLDFQRGMLKVIKKNLLKCEIFAVII